MKYTGIALVALSLLTSCSKTETDTTDTATEQASSQEISQVMEPRKLTSDTGTEINVTYFAQGDEVAVKLQNADMPEQTLSAKGTSTSGNPVFSNEEYLWEMTQEGKAGLLTDKNGTSTEYK